jgi:hypothetical protein
VPFLYCFFFGESNTRERECDSESDNMRENLNVSSLMPRISWLTYLQNLYHYHCFNLVNTISTFVDRLRLRESDKLYVV